MSSSSHLLQFSYLKKNLPTLNELEVIPQKLLQMLQVKTKLMISKLVAELPGSDDALPIYEDRNDQGGQTNLVCHELSPIKDPYSKLLCF